MSYLNWHRTGGSPIAGVVPFTYRDNVTYLRKLEDLYLKITETYTILNESLASSSAGIEALNDQYEALVAEWNATLSRLDPAAVAVLVAEFEATYGAFYTELDGRVTAVDTAYKAADASIRADYAAADNAVRNEFAASDATLRNELQTEIDQGDAGVRSDLSATIASNKSSADSAIADLQLNKADKTSVAGTAVSAVTAAVGTPGDLRAALDARYSTESSSFPATGSMGERFHISAYCTTNAQKQGKAVANAAVAAALADIDAYVATLAPATRAAGAPTLVVDGTFMITTPIRPRAGMWIIGNGPQSSRLITSNSHIIQLGANDWWYDFRVEGVGFEILPGGKSCIYAAGTAYAGTPFVNEAILVRGVITSCTFRSQSTTDPLIFLGNWVEMHECTWSNLEVDRATQSAASAMVFRPHQHNIMNSNTFRDIWLHGHNNENAYAFELTVTPNSGRVHNWTFKNVCGEQNPAGLLMLNSLNGFDIDHCVEWDSTKPYKNAIININSANGMGCCNGRIHASYPIGTVTFTGIASPLQTSNNSFDIHVTAPYSEGGPKKLVIGHGTSVGQCRYSYTVISANYVMNMREAVGMVITPGVVVTLPDSFDSLPGSTHLIINDSAGSVTVNCTGGRNVGPSSSYTLSARSAVRFVTGGQIAQGTASATSWIAVS